MYRNPPYMFCWAFQHRGGEQELFLLNSGSTKFSLYFLDSWIRNGWMYMILDQFPLNPRHKISNNHGETCKKNQKKPIKNSLKYF